ncbi:hypothetical protein M9Y10_025297 [Tritrichomonas musculus]|uniref:Protein kinase domain-containing protein n=1 Tax=Tritrichomonas musculus TaxID=1915356 RepID=A0ABR2HA37_9EUKA
MESAVFPSVNNATFIETSQDWYKIDGQHYVTSEGFCLNHALLDDSLQTVVFAMLSTLPRLYKLTEKGKCYIKPSMRGLFNTTMKYIFGRNYEKDGIFIFSNISFKLNVKTSGLNNYNQVGAISNDESDGYPIICPPLSSKIDVSNLFSYSVYYHHASWVTKDGKGYAIGDNSYRAILGSLPKSKLETATEIDMKDRRGIQCKFISILCGDGYTLYLISRTDGIKELAYVYESKNKGEPFFVNIETRQPVSLYGGYYNSAAIDTEGAIIPITESLFDSPLNPVKAVTLPGGEKAVSVACCDKFYLALSESGRVFKSSSSSELSFEEVEELHDKEIVDISGTHNHCFAVCSEGEVFVYGSDMLLCGALCLGKGVRKTDKFTKVASLEKYKITGAYAGSFHSLFRTEDGKVLSCGSNAFGELMLDRFAKNDKIYSPVETTIESGASFCIAGHYESAVFVGGKLPPNMPNRRLSKNNDHLTSRKTLSSSTKSKDSEYLKDKEISELKATKDRELLNQQAKLKEREKRETAIYKNHIRFLEERLLKYEKVQIFDINDTSTHRRPEIKPDDDDNDDDDITEGKKLKEGNQNIFIGEEDEEHHQVLKKIGEGATSIAYKIIDDRTSEVMCKKVVKIVEDEEAFNKLRNSMREFGALTSISHPSICRAIGMNTSEKVEENTSNKDSDYDYNEEDEDERGERNKKEKTTIALFLEYLPFKLKDVLKSDIMNDTLRVKICIEVAFGMKHLHQSGMIHRDLKIDNIMLNSILEAKIIDFDLVHIDDKDDQSLTKGVGTLDYMSPEMLNNEKYDNKTDVYSYGIVVFVLLTGHLPKQNMTDKMNKKPIKFPRHSSSLTSEGIEVINKCTAFEPKDRPSFSEILEMIENKKFKLAKEVDRDIVHSRYQELNRFESLYQNKEIKKPKK